MPLSYVIRPVNANPDKATDKYTLTKWDVSFKTPQYCDDNREVYRLFKDLSTKQREQLGSKRSMMEMDVRLICFCLNIVSVKLMICNMLH